MSPLERLGLEVAAFNLLGSRGKAALLCALIDGGGRIVPMDLLKQAKAWRWNEQPVSHRGLVVRISWLRDALDDLGLAGVITTAPHDKHQKASGYALPEPGRSAVITRLIEEAGA